MNMQYIKNNKIIFKYYIPYLQNHLAWNNSVIDAEQVLPGKRFLSTITEQVLFFSQYGESIVAALGSCQS
jgi:hypothetical protein